MTSDSLEKSLVAHSVVEHSVIAPNQQIFKSAIANTQNINVEETAKQISVRIFPEGDSGSGVVIARQNQTYTVITNAHVIDNNNGQDYQIMTADGVTHNAIIKQCGCFADLDLAFVTFESSEEYQVAQLAQSNVLYDINTYASGFPGYHYPNAGEIQSTDAWGLKAFLLSKGQAAMFIEKPLIQGYQLGYTNEVREGMSGGPVLNDQGLLVAINGRLKYPVQGKSAYTFIDGTQPSQSLFQQMEKLSWGIPVESFIQEVNSINNDGSVNNDNFINDLDSI